MGIGIAVDEILCEDAEVALYRAHTLDGRSVLVKALKGERATAAEYESLRHEVEATTLVGNDVAASPEEIATLHGHPTLVLRDDGGVPLLRAAPPPLQLERFLTIAIALVDALATLHARHMEHGALHPNDVLLLPNGRVELTGFGQAAAGPSKSTPPQRHAAGSWPYLSPEQTGRVGLPVDHRSDLYALGVVFFELLTGRLPFDSTDYVGWIHAHCAVVPPAVTDLEPGVPESVARIVHKLLVKAPEGRYQSAQALGHDLRRIKVGLRDLGGVDSFLLGSIDVAPPLRHATRAHGRSDEERRLFDALSRVSRDRHVEIVLVSGPIGIGKSTLLDALRRKAAAEGDPVVGHGRAPRGLSGVPACALLDALDEALHHALASSNESRAALAERFAATLGQSAPLLCALVPGLVRVLGEREPGVDVPIPETERRFVIALDKLREALSHGKRPLVLALDDLEHADAATFRVLQHWATASPGSAILVVGAYRSMQRPGEHPLRRERARLVDAGAQISEIVVGPLDSHAMVAWLVDLFHAGPEELRPLAELVCERSEGKPLFGRWFLETLYRKGAISYSPQARGWRFDLELARAEASLTKDLFTLGFDTLRTLPRTSRRALGLLSLYDRGATLELVQALLGVSEASALSALEPAFRARVIVRTDGRIRFCHEALQQIAANFATDQQQSVCHLAIARTLARGPAIHASRADLSDVVRHAAAAGPALADPDERLHVARLALAAGRAAQAATYFEAAGSLFRQGLELVGTGRRDEPTADDIAFALQAALVRTEFVTGALAAGRERGEALLGGRLAGVEQATVRCILAEAAALEGETDDAVREAVVGLGAVDYHLQRHPDHEETQRLAEASVVRIAASTGDITALPLTEDPNAGAACDLLGVLFAPAMLTDWNLVWSLAVTGVDRSLRFGNARSSGLTYALLGAWLARRGRFDEGVALGEAGYRLAQRDEYVACRPRASYAYAALLSYLTLPPKECAALCLREREVATSIGDQAFSCYLAEAALHFRIFAGEPLPDVSVASAEATALADHAGFPTARQLLRCIARYTGRMSGHFLETPDTVLVEAGPLAASPTPLIRFHHFLHELAWRYVAGDVAGARTAADRALALEYAATGFIDAIELRFYAALVVAAGGGAGSTPDLASLEAHLAVLEQFAGQAPESFGSRASLVRAELARLRGDDTDAARSYDAAIDSARSTAQLAVEAIACECAARFHVQRGETETARAFLGESQLAYEAWGARPKAAALRDHTPVATRRLPLNPPHLESLLLAQRSISSSLWLPDLYRRLLEATFNYGGTTRGCLLRLATDEPVLAAARGLDADAFGTADQPADARAVPRSLCEMARRLQRSIALVDTGTRHRYARDPYFERGRCCSAVCVPIIRAGKTEALLYLENTRTAGAFDADVLGVLDYVASQAAIALENASLYARLEKENTERSRAEQELATNQRLLASVLDASPAVIFVKNLESRYVLTNRRFEDIFHVDRHELVGKSDYELFPREVAARMQAADRRVIAEDRAVEFDDTVASDDGLHSYMTVKFPLRDDSARVYAVCGIATDVTARKAATEAVLHSLSLVEAAIESTADGILVIDLEGKIIRSNRRFTEQWRLPQEILEAADGRRALDYVLDQLADPEAFLAKVRSLYTDIEATSHDTLVCRDGRVFERYSQPQRLGDRVVGRVWSFRDVTARVRAFEERDQFLAEERRARAEAEEAVRIRDQFLSIASHELRTPLTSLALAVDSLGTLFGPHDKSPQAERALTIASRQIRRVSTLVALLLDVSRIRSGKLVLARAEVDLCTVVREVAALLADERARAGSELVVRTPATVLGNWDGARLEQVVVNLLTNALKFGRGRPIEIEVTREDAVARISVRDEGIGMSPEVVPTIFEPFARGVSAKHYGGLGLGLYIAYTIVKAHGGDVRVTSREGEGTTFTVTLPLNGGCP